MEYDPEVIFIDTSPALLGDCDGDGIVEQQDIRDTVWEVFDRDGSDIDNVSGGRFPGTVGCDSNEDRLVTIADAFCTLAIVFDLPFSCNVSSSSIEAVGEQTSVDLILPVAPDGLNGYVLAVTVPPQVTLVGFESDLGISQFTDGAVIAIDTEDIVQAGAVDTVIGTLVFEAVEVGTGEVTIEAVDTADDLFGVMNLVFPPISVVVE